MKKKSMNTYMDKNRKRKNRKTGAENRRRWRS